MHTIAYLILLAALLACLAAVVIGAVFAMLGKNGFLRWAERAQWTALALTGISSLILLAAFGARDYGFLYVYEHADNVLSDLYALSAFWAGQEGSLLFWLLSMALFGAGFSFTRGYRDQDDETKLWFWLFFLSVEAFFLLLLTCWSNPFIALAPRQMDGQGLNPLLQNPGMIFHPPLLFLGYAGLAVPACLGLAATMTGSETGWIKPSRNTNLVAWVFLTAGIILGGWWSYMELGWGGYWAWDPVENASLIPWLVSTAFVHTSIISSRRGALRRFTLALSVLALVMCFFATYLVRSGIIQSVHAFGKGGVGNPLLVFMLACIAVLVLVVILGEKPVYRTLSSLISRQGLLFITSWCFLALGAVVIMGTMWPLISSMWSPEPIGLDAAFYNRTCLPLFVLIALLLCFCPWMGWKQGLAGKTGFFLVCAAMAAGLAAFFILGIRRPLPLIAAASAGAALAGSAMSLFLLPWVRSMRSAMAASMVHFGLALIVLGVAFSGPYKIEKDVLLAPGEKAALGDFTFTYQEMFQTETPAMFSAMARIDVDRNGERLGVLMPERRFYRNFEQPFAEVSTLFSLTDELYAVFLGFDEQQRGTFMLSVNPLVNWIWIGGALMSVAGFFLIRGKPRQKA